MSATELANLRWQFIEPGMISMPDLKKLLVMCDYSKSESELAIGAFMNWEGQFIL